MDAWPHNRDELLLLDEVPWDIYVRTPEVRAPTPSNATYVTSDEHGQRWRAVYLQGMGMRRVRMS